MLALALEGNLGRDMGLAQALARALGDIRPEGDIPGVEGRHNIRLGEAGLAGRIGPVADRIDPVADRIDPEAGRIDPVVDRIDRVVGRIDRVVGRIGSVAGRIDPDQEVPGADSTPEKEEDRCIPAVGIPAVEGWADNPVGLPAQDTEALYAGQLG